MACHGLEYRRCGTADDRMASLPKVAQALGAVHGSLARRDETSDLLYLVDVDPFGASSLLVYVSATNPEAFSADEKRTVEARIRERLAKAGDWLVFVRWRSAAEQRQMTTKAGLRMEGESALHG